MKMLPSIALRGLEARYRSTSRGSRPMPLVLHLHMMHRKALAARLVRENAVYRHRRLAPCRSKQAAILLLQLTRKRPQIA